VPGQAEALAAARQAKWDEFFQSRKWRVVTEATGRLSQGEIVVTYDQGRFQISEPGKFRTPLGHPGRSGYLLAEVVAGQDTGAYACFGGTALRKAAEQYGAILNLPGAKTVVPVVHHVFDSDSGAASEGAS
jgi:hypothetical protein